MSALLPPDPRGHRNCCALTTTQTWTLTLGMPSVGPPYSGLTACGASLPHCGPRFPAVIGDGGPQGQRGRAGM